MKINFNHLKLIVNKVVLVLKVKINLPNLNNQKNHNKLIFH